MTKPLIGLALTTKTTKVTPEAWERANALKDELGCRLSDIVSACLLFMPSDELKRIIAENQAAIDKLPRAVVGAMRNVDKMSAAEKKMLIDVLKDG